MNRPRGWSSPVNPIEHSSNGTPEPTVGGRRRGRSANHMRRFEQRRRSCSMRPATFAMVPTAKWGRRHQRSSRGSSSARRADRRVQIHGGYVCRCRCGCRRCRSGRRGGGNSVVYSGGRAVCGCEARRSSSVTHDFFAAAMSFWSAFDSRTMVPIRSNAWPIMVGSS